MTEALRRQWEDWVAARPPVESALTRVAFYALLAGRTPTVAELAMSGVSEAALTETLETMVGQGLATVDGDSITGIGGLSRVPAPHALQWNGHPYWTWCALDAIGIPAAWGGSARVTSRTASDGAPVVLTLEDGGWIDPDPTLGIRLAEPSVARSLCGGT